MCPTPTVPEKIQKSIDENKLFDKSDLVLVAVSGGPDSITLLHALHVLGYKLHAATLNHCLRPEAVNECKVVQDFCLKLGICCTLGTVDIQGEKAKNGGSVQEAARRVRYEFLNRIADETGAGVIATAHNRDDQVETVLLNIMRGTGTKGLTGIPIKRELIVRPMLDVRRDEVEAYCSNHSLTPMRDLSNDSTKYARNEVRHKLIPYLEERFNPNVKEAILRLSEIADADSEYIHDVAQAWIKNEPALDAEALSHEHIAVQRAVLRSWLRSVCGIFEAQFEDIESIRESLCEPFAITLIGNVRVRNNRGWLSRDWSMERDETNQPLEPVAISFPGEIEFANWWVRISGQLQTTTQLAVRTWRAADRMAFPYGHKKLSDIFRELKTPIPDRWTLPVLAETDSNNVLAIANLIVSPLAPGLTFTAERI